VTPTTSGTETGRRGAAAACTYERTSGL
jgi:hypothetical protein